MKHTQTVGDIDRAKNAVRTAFKEPGPWLIVAKVDKQDRPAERTRHALPMHVYEAGITFHRVAVEQRAAKK